VRRRIATLVLAAAGLLSFPVAAQKDAKPTKPTSDSAKVLAIRRFMVVTKTDSSFIQGLEIGLRTQEESNPNLPAAFLPEFRARVRRDLNVFLERLVPAYDSAYTLADLEQLTAFFATPLGQRLIASQVRVTHSAAAIGEQWGAEVAAEVMLDLVRRGLVKP